MLYLFQATIEQRDLSNEKLYSVWLDEAEHAGALLTAGVIKFAYKVAGRNEVLIGVEIDSPDMFDELLLGLPFHRSGLWSHVTATLSPLRDYSDWYEDLKVLANGAVPSSGTGS